MIKKPLFLEIKEENINEEIFLNFIKGLKAKLDEMVYLPYVIRTANHSSHKTPCLLKYYSENKINVLYNLPYLSVFNSFELAFLYIKGVLYKNLFSTIEELNSKSRKFIKRTKISKYFIN